MLLVLKCLRHELTWTKFRTPSFHLDGWWGRKFGSHWMTPDDHEIKNALQPSDMTGDYSEYVLAGRWAAYEYQLQLHRDIGEMEQVARAPSCLPFWSFHAIGKTGYVVLDTRFYRSFTQDTANPLTGTPQLLEVLAQLENWTTDTDIRSIVVVSSIPLLFPSTAGAYVADWFEGDAPSLRSAAGPPEISCVPPGPSELSCVQRTPRGTCSQCHPPVSRVALICSR